MNNQIIKEIVDIGAIKDNFISPIYHYTAIENIPRIFTEESFCLRFTRYDCFEDKTEGIIIKTFYDSAIDKLYNNRILNHSDVQQLKSINIPEQFSMNHNGKVETDPYVMCFSKEKNSPYMYNNYIKNADKKGCCIGFYSMNFEYNSHRLNGCKIDSSSIIYGEDAVEYIYKFLYRFIELTGGIGSRNYQLFFGLIPQKLSKLKYFCKSECYRKENEYRVIIHFPKNIEKSNNTPYFCQKIFLNEKHYLLWYPNHINCSIESLSVNENVNQYDKLSINNYLKSTTYFSYRANELFI